MCYFITIAVPRGHVETLKGMVPRSLHLGAPVHRDISENLGSGYEAFTITSDGCSCGLFSLGPAADPGADERALRRKYGRAGWSPPKVERAVASAMSHRRSDERPGLRADVGTLLAAVAEAAGELVLVVVEYSGRPDRDRVTLRGSTRVSAGDLRAGAVEVSLDHLYTVQGVRT